VDQLTGVYTTLAEYTSREARYNLVLACLDHLAEEAQRSNVAATMALAEKLHVSQRSIQRWAKGGIQSCNVNAEAIIYAATMWIPEKAAEILVKDLEMHRRQLVETLPHGSMEAREVLAIRDDTPMSPDVGLRCPSCGKISPNPNYCTSCGDPMDGLSVRERAEAQEAEETAIMENPHLRAAALEYITEHPGARSSEIEEYLELSSYEADLVIEGALKAGLVAAGPWGGWYLSEVLEQDKERRLNHEIDQALGITPMPKREEVVV